MFMVNIKLLLIKVYFKWLFKLLNSKIIDVLIFNVYFDLYLELTKSTN